MCAIPRVLARDLQRHVYAVDLRNHGESGHAAVHDYTAMADDVAGFIGQHGLKSPTLIGHSMYAPPQTPPSFFSSSPQLIACYSRGAKTAMALALAEPDLIRDIVSVDNAPVDAVLATSFGKYVQGMKKIDEADVTRSSEADKILAEYEKVRRRPAPVFSSQLLPSS